LSDRGSVYDAPDTGGRLFLERRGYRQRRIIDAARILPIVGLLLWLVPLIWPDAGEGGAIGTAQATLYVFAIWVVLIAAGAFLAWRMAPHEEPASDGANNVQGSAR